MRFGIKANFFASYAQPICIGERILNSMQTRAGDSQFLHILRFIYNVGIIVKYQHCWYYSKI